MPLDLATIKPGDKVQSPSGDVHEVSAVGRGTFLYIDRWGSERHAANPRDWSFCEPPLIDPARVWSVVPALGQLVADDAEGLSRIVAGLGGPHPKVRITGYELVPS